MHTFCTYIAPINIVPFIPITPYILGDDFLFFFLFVVIHTYLMNTKSDDLAEIQLVGSHARGHGARVSSEFVLSVDQGTLP